MLLHPLRILSVSHDSSGAPSEDEAEADADSDAGADTDTGAGFVPPGVAEAVHAVFETSFRRQGGITVYRSGNPAPREGGEGGEGGGGAGSVDPALLELLDNPDVYLQAGRVELIAQRRRSGFDGLVTGSIAPSGGSSDGPSGAAPGEGVAVTLHCLNFTAGEIYYADTITGVFGADLIARVEEVAAGFARSVTEFDATTLTVRSTPPGATVFLDDVEIGVTPLERYRAVPGAYTLRLEAAGYLPGETAVALTDGEKAQVQVSLYEEEAAAVVEQVNAFAGEFHSLTVGTDVGFQPYGAQPDFFFPGFTFLYTGKWRDIGGGLGLSVASHALVRSFDTVVGAGTETITLDALQFFLTGRYYPVSVRRRVDVFLAAAGGVSFLTGYSLGNPPDYEEARVIAPYGRAEAGVGFVLMDFLRLELFGGYHYQGRAEIFRKQPYTWGEASFATESFHLHPFFVGVRAGVAVYPAALRARL